MKKLLITLLLALAVCAGAVELYWDTGPDGTGSPPYKMVAVLFNDCPSEGPGSTGGREGTVYSFRVSYKELSEDPVSLYLYSSEDLIPGRQYIPGEPLHEGELEYDETQEGDWHVYTLVEPFEVPSDFFAVIEQSGKVRATDPSRDYAHSAFRDRYGRWYCYNYDICIRVEWEPDETAVEETSWGAIKATK